MSLSNRCNCAPGTCEPAPTLQRRDFLRVAGAGAAALAVSRLPTMAGPFDVADFDKLVPADKKLDPAWVKSLYARGEPAVYREAELTSIGMPIGGICAGQVYLGGDGRLWHWDIFNQHIGTGAEHYAHPLPPKSPIEQGFALRVTRDGQAAAVRTLDARGFPGVTFRGEYPIGRVTYAAPDCPVQVVLEAYSPFIPLNTDDSSLPATLLQFTLTNTGAAPVVAEVAGWLENAVCHNSRASGPAERRNRIVREDGRLVLDSVAMPIAATAVSNKPDIVFADFEQETYTGWQAAGTAFGTGPIEKTKIPDYQGDIGVRGARAVNSHATAPGDNVGAKDGATGTLASAPFTIERAYIHFLIGGGPHAGRTCLNLTIDGKVVHSATGQGDNRMSAKSFDVREFQGKSATLTVVDAESGAWGNIGVDHIVFSDKAAGDVKLEDRPDYGTMAMALLDATEADRGSAGIGPDPADAAFGALSEQAARPLAERLIGALVRSVKLAPGATHTATFVLAWHFPNLEVKPLPRGRYYASRHPSAAAVAGYVAAQAVRLARETRLWRDTWYDSTLPYWFLDRTFLNTSILATSTSLRFTDGRFWGWEGVGCCHGTCGHVWQYAQAMGRIFPELERITRERVDFGLALMPNGAIRFRAEHNNGPAIDAQAGTILRAYREHQVSVNDAFLRRNWEGIKKATQWLIAQDGNGDGLIEGAQHNTLDADWFGPVAWLSGMYLAALRAAEAMAQECADTEFATACRAILERGSANLVARLYEGDYFINRPDPKRTDTINSGTGCHIDQVFGQGWAWQVGLGRVLPEKETLSALRSLWRYNFTPDVGPYRAANKPGRWYAMAGEAGLLMCTFPRSDWDYAKAAGKGPNWAAGYFNECMNGFEYQVASHMLWEGLLQEGLAITRAVHDRYHPARRNPWNEVECGDHYARSMASYGIFLAACGFEYHGPHGHIGFVPRLNPAQFAAPFTAAEGWGTYRQQVADGKLAATLELKYGKLRLRTLAIGPCQAAGAVKLTCAGKTLRGDVRVADGRALITLGAELTMEAGQKLEVTI